MIPILLSDETQRTKIEESDSPKGKRVLIDGKQVAFIPDPEIWFSTHEGGRIEAHVFVKPAIIFAN